jgi:hypothetical protein
MVKFSKALSRENSVEIKWQRYTGDLIVLQRIEQLRVAMPSTEFSSRMKRMQLLLDIDLAETA